MPFRLKDSENEFQATKEGKFEFRSFRHGKVYDEVPPEEAHRFETTESEAVPNAEGEEVKDI